MSKRQQLVAMYSMLDHVAQEASRSGFSLVATLTAAAAEATRDEIAAHDRSDRRGNYQPKSKQLTREKADSLV
jgi:hypothetical protein